MKNLMGKHDNLMRHLEMTIEVSPPEYAKVAMPLREYHKNGMGVAHGGAIFALADVTFGAAANAGRDYGVVSLSTTIEYLLPGKTGPLIGEAFAIRNGKYIQNYEVKIFDGSGALIARCMASGFQTDIKLPE